MVSDVSDKMDLIKKKGFFKGSGNFILVEIIDGIVCYCARIGNKRIKLVRRQWLSLSPNWMEY